MDHRTIVSFFTCQLVWVNRYHSAIFRSFLTLTPKSMIVNSEIPDRYPRNPSVFSFKSMTHYLCLYRFSDKVVSNAKEENFYVKNQRGITP